MYHMSANVAPIVT